MDRIRAYIGCAVDDPCLRGRVGEALAALDVGCVEVAEAPSASPLMAAIIVAAGSRGWSICVAALESGHPAIPHVVLVPKGRFSTFTDMLKASRDVRRAIHAVLEVDAALTTRLAEVLSPLLGGAIRRGKEVGIVGVPAVIVNGVLLATPPDSARLDNLIKERTGA